MKIRNGFVSNSSSSSFIVRKSALTEEQQRELRDLFYKHSYQFETEVTETKEFFLGDLEAHNGLHTGDSPIAHIFSDLMDEWNIKIIKDWNIEYCGSCELED